MGFRYVGPEVLEIHDEVLFLGKGDVVRWRNKLRKELEVAGKAKAPVNRRSAKSKSAKTTGGITPRGYLKSQVRAENFKISGKVLGVDLVSGAEYTSYVIHGTRDQYSRQSGGRFGASSLVLPGARVSTGSNANPTFRGVGSFPRRRVQHVRGQKANPFLTFAFNEVALRHPALVGQGFGLKKFG